MVVSSMSSRERMLATIRRQEHDHVPFSLHVGIGPWLKEPLYWRDQIERAQKQLALGLDPTIDLWIPWPQPSKDVQIKSWREKKGKEILITKEYHTPAGVLRQVVRETQDWCEWTHGPWTPTCWGDEKRQHFNMDLMDDYNVSRRLEPWVKGPEDLEALKYIIRPPEGIVLDEWRMDAQRLMERAQELDVLTQFRRTIVGDAFQWFCDIPWFLMQLYEDPGFVRDFFKIFQDWSLEVVKLALEVGVDVVQYRGWYEIPNYFGKTWKEFIYPAIEEHEKLVHSADRYLSYLLPEGQGAYVELLKETEIDILYAIDPRMLHGGDLSSLAAKLAESKTFWGGVNTEVTLISQNPKRIEREVKEAIDALNINNGLVLSAIALLETPTESIMHMIDSWKKHCNAK